MNTLDSIQCITSISGDFGRQLGAINGGSTPSAGAWPANNDGIFIPFYLRRPVLIQRLFSYNGNVASGNVDVGIYNSGLSLIISKGSTAQSGTNTLQFYDITDTLLMPGQYYWGVALSSTSGTLFRGNVNLNTLKALGCCKMASAFALPAIVTPATITANYLPVVGAEILKLL